MTLAVLLLVAAVLCWPAPRRRHELVGRHSSAEHLLPPADSPPPCALTAADLAASMHLMALALRSGASVVAAIDCVAASSPPRVRDDLRTVSAALAWGMPVTSAFAACGPGWSSAASCFAVADEVGVPAGRLLVEAARAVSADARSASVQAAARLGVHLVVPLGLAFLPAFCLTTIVPLVLVLTSDVLASP